MNRYAHYWTNTAPCYFNTSAGAGTYVNFYNTNDFALDKWQTDQNFKPDVGYNYDGYNGKFFRGTVILDQLFFPTNTYELFAYCVEARSYALGAQAGVHGVFAAGSQTDLQTVWPTDDHPQPHGLYSAHVWNSGEFRDDRSEERRVGKEC